MPGPRPHPNSPITRSLAKFGNNLGVCLPGNVESYDAGTQTASIRLGVIRLLPSATNEDEDEVEYLPPLVHVPVSWFRARGVSMVGYLQAGDPVTVFCCDRDISAWRRSGGLSEPDGTRTHHWSSSVAFPGLEADVGGFPAPSHAAALDSKVEAELNSLRTKLNALIVTFNAHTHAVAAFGTSAVPGDVTTTPAAAVGSVASARLKLDT